MYLVIILPLSFSGAHKDQDEQLRTEVTSEAPTRPQYKSDGKEDTIRLIQMASKVPTTAISVQCNEWLYRAQSARF